MDDSDEPRRGPGPIQKLINAVGGTVLVFALGWLVIHLAESGWGDKARPTVPTPPPPNAVGLPTAASPSMPVGGSAAAPPAAMANMDAVTASIKLQEQRAESQLRISKFRTQASDLQNLLKDLDTALTAWETRTAALPTSEAGRQIAADPTAVATYKALIDEPRASRSLLARARDNLQVLAGPVDEAAKHPEVAWSPDKPLALLDGLTAEVRKALTDYTGALRALDDLQQTAARSGKVAAGTLDQAINAQLAQRSETHALELKKIDDDARKAREQRELAQKAELQRLAAIAIDPDALKLLDFTGLNGDTLAWPAAAAAKAYGEPKSFEYYAAQNLAARMRVMYVPALDEYNRRNKLAIAQYKMSLHDLYRVALLSAANQKRLRSDEQLKQMIKETEAAGRANDAAEMTQVLNGGFKLPATKYP